ncbi:MAG: MFS transporter, partial [Sphingomonas sp.]|nr:MFS transporter [Sphingomonas sp.]
LLMIAGSGGMIVAVPIFSELAVTKSASAAFALVLVPLVIIAAYNSIAAVFKAELFPPHIRSLGVSLPYAIGNAALGGTAEYVALWFKSEGLESGFYWYIAGLLAVSTAGFLMLPETKRTSLIVED